MQSKNGIELVDIIFIAGAPGSGKTTISELLKKELDDSPLIDFGWFREFHLDREWKNQSVEEESMTFENLQFTLRNYVKHGYKNVIVNDLQEHRVLEIPKKFADLNYIIITLEIKDDDVLKERILSRNSGFTDYEKALEWNRQVIERKTLPNEYKIDNSSNSPEETVNYILQKINI